MCQSCEVSIVFLGARLTDVSYCERNIRSTKKFIVLLALGAGTHAGSSNEESVQRMFIVFDLKTEKNLVSNLFAENSFYFF